MLMAIKIYFSVYLTGENHFILRTNNGNNGILGNTFHVKAFDFLDTYKSIIWSKKTINFVRISRYFHIQKHLLLKLSRNTEIRCGKEGVKIKNQATKLLALMKK